MGRINTGGGSGSGVDIQGIIEEYVAGGNISAGDFVEYVNNYRN